MKIGDSIKQGITNIFRNVLFVDRVEEGVNKTLNEKIKDSDTMRLIPPVPYIKVENINELTDKWVMEFEDAVVECIVTWRKAKYVQGGYILEDIA